MPNSTAVGDLPHSSQLTDSVGELLTAPLSRPELKSQANAKTSAHLVGVDSTRFGMDLTRFNGF